MTGARNRTASPPRARRSVLKKTDLSQRARRRWLRGVRPLQNGSRGLGPPEGGASLRSKRPRLRRGGGHPAGQVSTLGAARRRKAIGRGGWLVAGRAQLMTQGRGRATSAPGRRLTERTFAVVIPRRAAAAVARLTEQARSEISGLAEGGKRKEDEPSRQQRFFESNHSR